MKVSFLLAEAAYPYSVLGDKTLFSKAELTELTYDSRTASPNTGFVCLSGVRTDGHAYAEKAYALGCRVFFVERALALPEDALQILVNNTRAALPYLSDALFSHPQKELCVIGVTGTKGKTTVTNLIASVLNASGRDAGTIGTIGISYHGKTAPTVNSTPESYVLHKTFREMADAGVKYVVMEVSSQAMFTYRVDGIRFDAAVFTNLTKDHVGEGEHPTFEHYKDCKKRLFSRCDYALLNSDSPYSAEFAAACACPHEIFSRADGTNADLRAENIQPWKHDTALGISFDVWEHGQLCGNCSLRLPGVFNAENALAAAGILRHLGLTWQEILPPLARAAVPGRFEILDALPYCTVVLDYAHNGMSMESLLSTVRSYQPKRILCVYGSVGGRTYERRRELAAVSGDLADFCIITTDNPDFEDPEQIVAEISSYYTEDSCPHLAVVDRKEAILRALSMALPGDILLFCGKGHETYQIVRGTRVPFSEKEIISSACAEMRTPPQKAAAVSK